MTLYSRLVMFDLKVFEKIKVGQVLHLRSLHLVDPRPELDLVPTAAMNEGPPSSEFTTTPALPCRERRILLGGLAPGEVTRLVVCTNLACDRV